MSELRFIVVADSHIRFPDDDVATYPSNALMLDRNQRVVELCSRLEASFVVHLGDIVHPLPVEQGHEPAVELAASVYNELDLPIYCVPGNHDIGDKPDAMVAVPAVSDENYAVFERYWGPAFQSFDVAGCHFVIVDTPVLNSGLEREAKQRVWIEQDLERASQAGQRIYMFSHYPPFVREHREDEHYDNLGEPGRTWFLDLLERHGVEAVFSGHVHNFLYNHHKGTELYVLPSTGFVRPDYSELAAVAPESEGGRDDPAKLGFLVVDIDAGGHRIMPVRTNGAVDVGSPMPKSIEAAVRPEWRSPIGVTLRHGWMSATDFPTAGLDEFRRKTIRNDALLLALWEARIGRVRIPIEDIATVEQLARIGQLEGRGLRFSVRSAGIPDERIIERVAAVQDRIERWELVLWPAQFETAVRRLAGISSALTVTISPVVPLGDPGAVVHHFVTAGFSTDAVAEVAGLAAADSEGLVDEIGFRVAPGDEIEPGMVAAQHLAEAQNRRAVVTVELPRRGESTRLVDDDAVADRVEEAVRAALRHPQVPVFLDSFVDHDRSYYPRNGLIDRRYNPRPALERLIELASK